MLLLAALSVWLARPLFDGLPWVARKFALIGTAAICFLPYGLLRAFFPPAIDITAYRNTVDYESRSLGSALEFAMLNDAMPKFDPDDD